MESPVLVFTIQYWETVFRSRSKNYLLENIVTCRWVSCRGTVVKCQCARPLSKVLRNMTLSLLHISPNTRTIICYHLYYLLFVTAICYLLFAVYYVIYLPIYLFIYLFIVCSFFKLISLLKSLNHSHYSLTTYYFYSISSYSGPDYFGYYKWCIPFYHF